jgi:hypothetical protein
MVITDAITPLTITDATTVPFMPFFHVVPFRPFPAKSQKKKKGKCLTSSGGFKEGFLRIQRLPRALYVAVLNKDHVSHLVIFFTFLSIPNLLAEFPEPPDSPALNLLHLIHGRPHAATAANIRRKA